MPKEKKRKKKEKKKDKKKDKKRKLRELEEEKRRKKREKALQKANETPEERQKRRLAKKEAKRRKREEAATLFGYTNSDNRFGDNNLTSNFVWKKKYEKEIAQGLDPRKLTKDALRKQQAELRREIEKVKERRLKREKEKAELDALREQMDREKDLSDNLDWEEKEEQFHLRQAALRSEIRIKEGREKAIDLLAKNLNLFKTDETVDADIAVDLDVELTEPYLIFEGLNHEELVELLDDIAVHINLGSNLDYWEALKTVCEDEIQRAKAVEEMYNSKEVVAVNPSGLPAAVQDDVIMMFDGKPLSRLRELEVDIRKKLDGKDDSGVAVDVEYWEALAKQLQVYKAKAFLHEFHQRLLLKRLKQLKEQHLKELTQQRSSKDSAMNDDDADDDDDDFEPPLIPFDSDEVKGLDITSDDKGNGPTAMAVDDDAYSPILLHDVDELDVVDPEDDAKELEKQRQQVLEFKHQQAKEVVQRLRAGPAKKDVDVLPSRFATTDDALMDEEMAAGMGGDENQFSVEESVGDTPYWWHDKYRPRKPRYFNRVKTGYDWHKYNGAHYDKENPPPKVVQGYKFNIFYPDLIDKSKPPTFRLDVDPDNHDYATIRFMAGPPYEDIAFRIVHKPWEHGHRRGYKCSFDRGVLRVYFNFQKVFYRR